MPDVGPPRLSRSIPEPDVPRILGVSWRGGVGFGAGGGPSPAASFGDVLASRALRATLSQLDEISKPQLVPGTIFELEMGLPLSAAQALAQAKSAAFGITSGEPDLDAAKEQIWGTEEREGDLSLTRLSTKVGVKALGLIALPQDVMGQTFRAAYEEAKGTGVSEGGLFGDILAGLKAFVKAPVLGIGRAARAWWKGEESPSPSRALTEVIRESTGFKNFRFPFGVGTVVDIVTDPSTAIGVATGAGPTSALAKAAKINLSFLSREIAEDAAKKAGTAALREMRKEGWQRLAKESRLGDIVAERIAKAESKEAAEVAETVINTVVAQSFEEQTPLTLAELLRAYGAKRTQEILEQHGAGKVWKEYLESLSRWERQTLHAVQGGIRYGPWTIAPSYKFQGAKQFYQWATRSVPLVSEVFRLARLTKTKLSANAAIAESMRARGLFVDPVAIHAFQGAYQEARQTGRKFISTVRDELRQIGWFKLSKNERRQVYETMINMQESMPEWARLSLQLASVMSEADEVYTPRQIFDALSGTALGGTERETAERIRSKVSNVWGDWVQDRFTRSLKSNPPPPDLNLEAYIAEAMGEVPENVASMVQKMYRFWDDIHDLAVAEYGLSLPYRLDFTWPRALSEVRLAAMRETEEVAEAARRFARPKLASLRKRRWDGPLVEDIFEQDPDQLIRVYAQKLARDITNLKLTKNLHTATDMTGEPLALFPEEVLSRLKPLIDKWREANATLVKQRAQELKDLLEEEGKLAEQYATLRSMTTEAAREQAREVRQNLKRTTVLADATMRDMVKVGLEYAAIPDMFGSRKTRLQVDEGLALLDEIQKTREAAREAGRRISVSDAAEKLDRYVATISKADPIADASARWVERAVAQFSERASDAARLADLMNRYVATTAVSQHTKDWAKASMRTIKGAYRNEDVLEAAQKKAQDVAAQADQLIANEVRQSLHRMSPVLADAKAFADGLLKIVQIAKNADALPVGEITAAKEFIGELSRAVEAMSRAIRTTGRIPEALYGDAQRLAELIVDVSEVSAKALEVYMTKIAHTDPIAAMEVMLHGASALRLTDVIEVDLLRQIAPDLFSTRRPSLAGLSPKLRQVVRQVINPEKGTDEILRELVESETYRTTREMAAAWAMPEQLSDLAASLDHNLQVMTHYLDAIRQRGDRQSLEDLVDRLKTIRDEAGSESLFAFIEATDQERVDILLRHIQRNQEVFNTIRAIAADVASKTPKSVMEAAAAVRDHIDRLPWQEWANLRDVRLVIDDLSDLYKQADTLADSTPDEAVGRYFAAIGLAHVASARAVSGLIAKINRPLADDVSITPVRHLAETLARSRSPKLSRQGKELLALMDASVVSPAEHSLADTVYVSLRNDAIELEEYLSRLENVVSELLTSDPTQLFARFRAAASKDFGTTDALRAVFAHAISTLQQVLIPTTHFDRSPLALFRTAISTSPKELMDVASRLASGSEAAPQMLAAYLDQLTAMAPALRVIMRGQNIAQAIKDQAAELVADQRRLYRHLTDILRSDSGKHIAEILEDIFSTQIRTQIDKLPQIQTELAGLASLGQVARLEAFRASMRRKRTIALVAGAIKNRMDLDSFRDFVAAVDPHSMPLVRELYDLADANLATVGRRLRKQKERELFDALGTSQAIDALTSLYTKVLGEQLQEAIPTPERKELADKLIALVDRVMIENLDPQVVAAAGAIPQNVLVRFTESGLDSQRLLSAFLQHIGFGRAIEASSRLGYLAPLGDVGVAIPPEWAHVTVPQWLVKAIRSYHEPLRMTQTIIDQLMHFWKVTKIGFRPGFHIRNMTSNLWMLSASGHYRGPHELLRDIIEVIAGRLSKTEIEIAQQTGLLSSVAKSGSLRRLRLWDTPYGSFTAAELASTGLVDEGFLAKISKPGLFVGSHVENIARLALLKRIIKETPKSQLGKPEFAQTAIKEISRVLMDPTLLTTTERKLRRYFVPFYTWIRHNLGYQLYLFSRRPFLYWQLVTAPTRMFSSRDGPSLGKSPYELLPIMVGDRIVYLDLPPVDFVNISQATNAAISFVAFKRQLSTGEGLADLRRFVGDALGGPIVASASMIAGYDIFRGEKLTPRQRKEWLIRQFVPEGGTLLSLRTDSSRLWGWLFGVRTEHIDRAQAREAQRRLTVARTAAAEAQERGKYLYSPKPSQPRYGMELLPTAPQLYGWRKEMVDRWWRSIFDVDKEARDIMLRDLMGQPPKTYRTSSIRPQSFYRQELREILG